MTQGGKIVFAGLARDVEPFLPQILRNIESLARQFSEWALLVVENDSKDRTKQILKEWIDAANAAGVRRAASIELDGLAERLPGRTERLAFVRNQYLNVIANSGLKDFDTLAVLDMDEPNFYPNAMENFLGAVRFLGARDDVAAVFPNQLPVYYDIWALRAKDWCPGDCMQEIMRVETVIGSRAAWKRYIFDRQVFIDPVRPPIEVESAFGGIGLYKIPEILNARYEGLTPDGAEICEHVPFHRAIREGGKKFFVLPDFLNYTSFAATDFGEGTELKPVTVGRITLQFLAAIDHPITVLRRQFPHCGERFAQLASLYSRARSGSVLEIGAGIGVNLALCRLYGCSSEYICVEPRQSYFILLSTNALLHRGLFAKHERISKAEGWDGGAAGLVRIDACNDPLAVTDTLGRLKEQRPIVWIEANIAASEIPAALPASYANMILFDQSGAELYAGPLQGGENALKTRPGTPVEFAFFTRDADDIFEAFRSLIQAASHA